MNVRQRSKTHINADAYAEIKLLALADGFTNKTIKDCKEKCQNTLTANFLQTSRFCFISIWMLRSYKKKHS